MEMEKIMGSFEGYFFLSIMVQMLIGVALLFIGRNIKRIADIMIIGNAIDEALEEDEINSIMKEEEE